ncbi:hypothetical protein THAOC_07065, partial [Thalassiosira oceanica]
MHHCPVFANPKHDRPGVGNAVPTPQNPQVQRKVFRVARGPVRKEKKGTEKMGGPGAVRQSGPGRAPAAAAATTTA